MIFIKIIINNNSKILNKKINNKIEIFILRRRNSKDKIRIFNSKKLVK
jgi:hypothetical protein